MTEFFVLYAMTFDIKGIDKRCEKVNLKHTFGKIVEVHLRLSDQEKMPKKFRINKKYISAKK